MTSLSTVLISFLALIVAAFSLIFSIEKLRLDLYNRRFDIYIRTLRLYQGLVQFGLSAKEGTIQDIHTDFIIAFRESKFLFRPESGIHGLLDRLNRVTTTILTHVPQGIPPEQLMAFEQERADALTLWNSSIEQLEDLMAPYLNYHYTSVFNAPTEWLSDFVAWIGIGRHRR